MLALCELTLLIFGEMGKISFPIRTLQHDLVLHIKRGGKGVVVNDYKRSFNSSATIGISRGRQRRINRCRG